MIDAVSPMAALTGGGTAAILYATAYAYRQFKLSRGEDRATPVEHTSAAVTDAATTNGLLLAALKEEREAGQAALREEREEVQRLSLEVADLRKQNTDLYERMREQRREYERIVAELSSRVESLSAQVDAFKRRLSADDEG